jgi:hypothetical protein
MGRIIGFSIEKVSRTILTALCFASLNHRNTYNSFANGASAHKLPAKTKAQGRKNVIQGSL